MSLHNYIKPVRSRYTVWNESIECICIVWAVWYGLILAVVVYIPKKGRNSLSSTKSKSATFGLRRKSPFPPLWTSTRTSTLLSQQSPFVHPSSMSRKLFIPVQKPGIEHLHPNHYLVNATIRSRCEAECESLPEEISSRTSIWAHRVNASRLGLREVLPGYRTVGSKENPEARKGKRYPLSAYV